MEVIAKYGDDAVNTAKYGEEWLDCNLCLW